ncbi:hypothetical protein P5673_001386 [Acropora cervicornis]|uniref:Uncharacterized protein n=1 Tax=Acropora cervicornis TaxID=6130 RepID=A0AAD9R6C6_ACRCE|nr:hypothetical protein P5673_001386 [Acropora cervicornis]
MSFKLKKFVKILIIFADCRPTEAIKGYQKVNMTLTRVVEAIVFCCLFLLKQSASGKFIRISMAFLRIIMKIHSYPQLSVLCAFQDILQEHKITPPSKNFIADDTKTTYGCTAEVYGNFIRDGPIHLDIAAIARKVFCVTLSPLCWQNSFEFMF